MFSTRLFLTCYPENQGGIIWNLDTQSIETIYTYESMIAPTDMQSEFHSINESNPKNSKYKSLIIRPESEESEKSINYFCWCFGKSFDIFHEDPENPHSKVFVLNDEGDIDKIINTPHFWNGKYILGNDILKISGFNEVVGRNEFTTINLSEIGNNFNFNYNPTFYPYCPSVGTSSQKEHVLYQQNGNSIFAKGNDIYYKLNGKSPKIIYSNPDQFAVVHIHPIGITGNDSHNRDNRDNRDHDEFSVIMYILERHSFFSCLIRDTWPNFIKQKKLTDTLFDPANNVELLSDGRFVFVSLRKLLVVSADLLKCDTFTIFDFWEVRINEIVQLKSRRRDVQQCHELLESCIPIKNLRYIILKYLEIPHKIAKNKIYYNSQKYIE